MSISNNNKLKANKNKKIVNKMKFNRIHIFKNNSWILF